MSQRLHHALEQLQTPVSDLDRALRSNVSSPRRLRRALEATRTRDLIDLTAMAPTLLPSHGMSILAPGRESPPFLPAKVHTGVRRVVHVPGLQPPRRFPVASIDLSRADIALPYGVQRQIDVRTLKAIAGGAPFDQLLKKTARGWAFVDDGVLIDLTDASQEYRLGRLTIFS